MDIDVMDTTDYTTSIADNDLSLIMCNYLLSSVNLNENNSCSDPVNDNSSIACDPRSSIDEDLDSLLEDLDPQWNQKAPNNLACNPDDESKHKKSLFEDDEDEDVDIYGWTYKPTDDWEKSDTINWLLWAGTELGHSFGRMSPELAMPGKDLVRLSKTDFQNFDPYFGDKLYDLLQEKHDSSSNVSSTGATCGSSKSTFDEETLFWASDELSDSTSGESASGSDPANEQEPSKNKRPRLWQFVRHLLLDPEFCPGWIRWEDYEKKTFRFVRNESVAKLWGQLNNKPNMTYKKFTRAIRHYYKSQKVDEVVFLPVHQRLVYKFGDMVGGLETDDPNFERALLGNSCSIENPIKED